MCLVVIADVKGSAPRETGAMMLVHADHIQGSIGGGELSSPPPIPVSYTHLTLPTKA